METAHMYERGYEPEQMAKIRGLGVSTIFNHLVLWYLGGGALDITKFVSSQEESQILKVLPATGSQHVLRTIKDQLPEEISYEKIRMIIAKRQKERG